MTTPGLKTTRIERDDPPLTQEADVMPLALPMRSDASGEASSDATLELGAILGEGGMGIVREAVQVTLRRSVAVKELRAARATKPGAVAALLREAWVSGNLEHPNIVPVHALVPGDGSPRLVMKRVEGIAWSEQLAARPSVADELDHHLGVLQSVCRAIEFAHSRGVAHLDLKPDNVMLGRYGEVYVVDWGIAASLGDDGPSWLPKARDIDRVCGTPSSLAPEQAEGDGPRIGVRSDVYGLGTILHEILTGTRRHGGASVSEVVQRARVSEPVAYGEGVPRELAAVANRATARDPAERFADAAALRKALDDYLAHRGATRLCDGALARLEQIERMMADTRRRTPAQDAALERLMVECGFAFEQSLASWPEGTAARAGLRRLRIGAIEDALVNEQMVRAEALLSELDEAPAELRARVAALRDRMAAREATRARLERLGHETDVNFNRLSRSAFAGICGALWVAWNLGLAWLTKGPLAPLGYPLLVGSVGLTLVVYALALWIFRRTLLTTMTNRAILWLFGGWFSIVLLGYVGSAVAGDAPTLAIVAMFPIYLCFCLSLAIFIDRRGGLVGALATLPFVLIGRSLPHLAFELSAILGGAVGFAFAWSWRRPGRSPFEARRG